jgi:hypothetical protein
MSRVFTRTISGLNNQHLFYKVDFIVFVEGGKEQYNKSDVYSGKYNPETEDIIFWKRIFGNFANGKKLKFKSVGSKTTIKEIAIDIIDGRINKVLVAMDNEFDEILNKRMIHKNIYYTNGYSWENDVWNDDVIENVIEQLTAIGIENDDIKSNFSSLMKNLKIAVYADGYLFKKNSSFFPRKSSPLFCVECNPVDLPFIKAETIQAKISEKSLKKTSLYSFGSRYSINTKKFCYGHLLADYCCQLIIHYLKNRHSIKNIPKDIIYRMGINRFFTDFFQDSEIYEYYKEQFEKNVA